MKKKTVALLMSLVLIFGVAVGGTIAWLMDTTEKVVNVFTVGDIEIELTEDAGDVQTDKSHQFKVVPGTDIAKDPKVTFKEDSEACWLFVKIDKVNWNANLGYQPAAGWTLLESKSTDASAIYFRKLTAAEAKANQVYYVLKGDTNVDKGENGVITVKDTLNADDMEDMQTSKPQLTFTAYAIQYENFEPAAGETDAVAAAKAWDVVSAA